VDVTNLLAAAPGIISPRPAAPCLGVVFRLLVLRFSAITIFTGITVIAFVGGLLSLWGQGYLSTSCSIASRARPLLDGLLTPSPPPTARTPPSAEPGTAVVVIARPARDATLASSAMAITSAPTVRTPPTPFLVANLAVPGSSNHISPRPLGGRSSSSSSAFSRRLSSLWLRTGYLHGNVPLPESSGRRHLSQPHLNAIPPEFRPFHTTLGRIQRKRVMRPKFRSIQYFSFPDGASINDGIDPYQFRIRYRAFLSSESPHPPWPCVLLLEGRRSRCLSLNPHPKTGLGHARRIWLFIDMYLPFGLRSAPYIFTSLMDLFT
jgi:hypothetical protein